MCNSDASLVGIRRNPLHRKRSMLLAFSMSTTLMLIDGHSIAQLLSCRYVAGLMPALFCWTSSLCHSLDIPDLITITSPFLCIHSRSFASFLCLSFWSCFSFFFYSFLLFYAIHTLFNHQNTNLFLVIWWNKWVTCHNPWCHQIDNRRMRSSISKTYV